MHHRLALLTAPMQSFGAGTPREECPRASSSALRGERKASAQPWAGSGGSRATAQARQDVHLAPSPGECPSSERADVSSPHADVSSPHAAVRHTAVHSVTTATQPVGTRNKSIAPPISIYPAQQALCNRELAPARRRSPIRSRHLGIRFAYRWPLVRGKADRWFHSWPSPDPAPIHERRVRCGMAARIEHHP